VNYISLRSADLKLSGKLAEFVCAAVLMLPLTPAFAAPSTFGTVIGSGLLCLGQLDAGFFYNYLAKQFGPPYKHEGNAWWFKAPAVLWGAQITDVLVSDTESPQRFVAAVSNMKPEELTASIKNNLHILFVPVSQYSNPVRVSQAGSKIIYFGLQSKIFCAKDRELAPG
jgi:hypothetical protein